MFTRLDKNIKTNKWIPVKKTIKSLCALSIMSLSPLLVAQSESNNKAGCKTQPAYYSTYCPTGKVNFCLCPCFRRSGVPLR